MSKREWEQTVADLPLTPISFLVRSAGVWADRTAVVDRDRSWTYRQHYDRIRQTAGVLADELGIGRGDRVATVLPNVAEHLELHYAVAGSTAVLVPLNTRLAASDYEYVLGHSGARVVVAHQEYGPLLAPAIAAMGTKAPKVLWLEGDKNDEWNQLVELAPLKELSRPVDERSLLSINYTSGTTGRPKGVMTTHRGAYLHTLGVIVESRLEARSRYLWTLPMFHCNGWAYTWAVTAAGGSHVCLDTIDLERIWHSLTEGRVTHFCASPTVVVMLLGSEYARPLTHSVSLFVGGAPPAPTLLQRAAELNIDVTHLYGLTETYGPLAVCVWNPEWDVLTTSERALLRARQGVATVVTEMLRVVNDDLTDVPADGETVGEIVMRGNNVMTGYFNDPEATSEAFRGGWFHSGDLGVMHPDHRIELRDRLRDVIISGGENIASVEVEQALMAHPAVAEAAVVAAPDEKWGEVCVAFVTQRGSEALDIAELTRFLRERLAHFKVPKKILLVDELPKTGTGKIQKFALRDSVRGSASSSSAAGPST